MTTAVQLVAAIMAEPRPPKVRHFTDQMPRYRYDAAEAETWLAGEYHGCALPPRQPVEYPPTKNRQAQAWRIDAEIHTSDRPWRMETGPCDATKTLRPGGPTAGITALGAGDWRSMPERVGTATGLNTWTDGERAEFSSAVVTHEDHTPQIWQDQIPRRKPAKLPKNNTRMGLPEILLMLGLGNPRDWPRSKDSKVIAYEAIQRAARLSVAPAPLRWPRRASSKLLSGICWYFNDGDNRARKIKVNGEDKRYEVPTDLRPNQTLEPMVRSSGTGPAVDEHDHREDRRRFHGGMCGSGERITMRPGFWNVSTSWIDRTDGLLEGQEWSAREASSRWVDGDWVAFPVCHQCGGDLQEGQRKVCSKVCERAADAKRKAKQRRLARGERIYPRDERGWYVSPTTTWLLAGPQPPQSSRIYPAQPNLKGGYALRRQIMRGTAPMWMTLEHTEWLADARTWFVA